MSLPSLHQSGVHMTLASLSRDVKPLNAAVQAPHSLQRVCKGILALDSRKTRTHMVMFVIIGKGFKEWGNQNEWQIFVIQNMDRFNIKNETF